MLNCDPRKISRCDRKPGRFHQLTENIDWQESILRYTLERFKFKGKEDTLSVSRQNDKIIQKDKIITLISESSKTTYESRHNREAFSNNKSKKV